MYISSKDRNYQQQQTKDPGDGEGGGEKPKTSGDSKRQQKDYDDLYEDLGYDDYEDDDEFESSYEDEEARQLSKLLEDCESDLNEANSRFTECKKMWGMTDIEFNFGPGALETIANQALYQQTGEDGISAILEKLFLTIKFDILGPQSGTKVTAIEITEQAVLGRDRPTYYYDTTNNKRSSVYDSAYSSANESSLSEKPFTVNSGSKLSYHRQHSNGSLWYNTSSSSSSYFHRNITNDLAPIREETKSVHPYNKLSEFDLDILDQIEL